MNLLTTAFSDGTLTVFLSGEIDHHTARNLREETDETILIKRPKLTVLDFSGVTFMDSSGVGLIMGRYRLCLAWDCRLAVKGLSARDEKIIRLSGLDSLIDFLH